MDHSNAGPIQNADNSQPFKILTVFGSHCTMLSYKKVDVIPDVLPPMRVD